MMRPGPMSNVQRTMEAAVMIITVMSSKKHFGVDDCRGSDCRTPGLGADIGPEHCVRSDRLCSYFVWSIPSHSNSLDTCSRNLNCVVWKFCGIILFLLHRKSLTHLELRYQYVQALLLRITKATDTESLGRRDVGKHTCSVLEDKPTKILHDCLKHNEH